MISSPPTRRPLSKLPLLSSRKLTQLRISKVSTLLLLKYRLPSRLQAKRCTATLTLLVLLIPPLVHSPVLVPPLRLLMTTSPTLTSKK